MTAAVGSPVLMLMLLVMIECSQAQYVSYNWYTDLNVSRTKFASECSFLCEDDDCGRMMRMMMMMIGS